MSGASFDPVFIGPGGSPGPISAAEVGSKAAELQRLASLRLPVPPAFVLPTSLCAGVVAGDEAALKALRQGLVAGIGWLAQTMKRRLGDARAPLFVSVRSGAERSMPGMMDTGVATTTDTGAATIIQTRHRVPETPLTEKQILVYQVPIPEPLRFLEPRETETRAMHALAEYGVMQVKLYEDIARHGHIATTYAYPVSVAGRYVTDPSPIPKFDNPKLDDCPALQLFGAGREKRIYAIPPYTRVVALDFEDHPFERTKFEASCAFCGSTESFLDEVVTDDAGGRMYVCSDTDYCQKRQAAEQKDAAQ